MNELTLDIYVIQEYLKDMGITVLGDIIAILKHAKQVQSRLTTDRALNQSQKQDQNKIGSLSTATSSSKGPSSVSDPKQLNQRESRAAMNEKVPKSTGVEISKEKEGYDI